MKIAFLITSTGWGGLEMNVVKLAKLLLLKDYEIILITQEKSTIYISGKEYFPTSFLLDKTKKHFDFKSAKNIGNYLKKNKVNTLLVFDNKDLDLATWTKKLFYTKIKIIYQQHMQIGINKKDFIHTFRYNSIDCWISPLEYLKNEVVERTKFPKEKIKVIPICLNTSKFINKKYSKEDALKLLNISPKFPLLGIVGRISEKKGQLFLIDSLIRLKQEGVSIELLIFGSATINDIECQAYNKLIIEKVKNNNLEQVVHFIEFREDVSQFYNAVDVFAMASEGETYGMVTIEAMLSKLPIIATNSGGTSEVLNFGKFGLLYEPKNSNDFCEKLIYLLTNTQTTHKMIDEAFENAKTKYASEIEVEGIDKLIRGR
jgi:D-inositol-3-phosphate glycosyltransferase